METKLPISGTTAAKWVREFLCVLFGVRDPTVPPAKPVAQVALDPPQRKS